MYPSVSRDFLDWGTKSPWSQKNREDSINELSGSADLFGKDGVKLTLREILSSQCL